jgi:hypothetical protein
MAFFLRAARGQPMRRNFSVLSLGPADLLGTGESLPGFRRNPQRVSCLFPAVIHLRRVSKISTVYWGMTEVVIARQSSRPFCFSFLRRSGKISRVGW